METDRLSIIKIKGRGALPGVAEGVALVFPDSIAGNSGAIGDKDGVIYEKGSINYGKSIHNAIIVMPCSKGSNGFSSHMKSAYISGVRPAGIVSTIMDGRLGVVVASLNIPTVADFKGDDPVQTIKTGDWVQVDGHTGVVTVTRQDT